MCPASTATQGPEPSANCPTDRSDMFTELAESGRFYSVTHFWNHEIPEEAAADWNCKFHIRAARSLIDAVPEGEDPGLIYLNIEPYNFDSEIYVVVQPY